MDTRNFADEKLSIPHRERTFEIALRCIFGKNSDTPDIEDGPVILSQLKFDGKLTEDNEEELRRLYSRGAFIAFYPVMRQIVWGDQPIPEDHWWWRVDIDGVPAAAKSRDRLI